MLNPFDDCMLSTLRMRRDRSRHFLVRAIRKRMLQDVEDFLPHLIPNNHHGLDADRSDSFNQKPHNSFARLGRRKGSNPDDNRVANDTSLCNRSSSEQESKPPSHVTTRKGKTKRYRSSYVMHCSKRSLSSGSNHDHLHGSDIRTHFDKKTGFLHDSQLANTSGAIMIPVTHLSNEAEHNPDFVSPKLLLQRNETVIQRSQRQVARVKVASAGSRSYVRTEICETHFPKLVHGVNVNSENDQSVVDSAAGKVAMSLVPAEKYICSSVDDDEPSTLSLMGVQTFSRGIEDIETQDDVQPGNHECLVPGINHKSSLAPSTKCSSNTEPIPRFSNVNHVTRNYVTTHDRIEKTQASALTEVLTQNADDARGEALPNQQESAPMDVGVYTVHTETSFISPYNASPSPPDSLNSLFRIPSQDDIERITDFSQSELDSEENINICSFIETEDRSSFQNNRIENESVTFNGSVSTVYESRLDSDHSDWDSDLNENDLRTSSPTVESKSFLHKHESSSIPKFYFPCGKPPPTDQLKSTLRSMSSAFNACGKERLPMKEMIPIAKACGCPSYWKAAIFKASCPNPDCTEVRRSDVLNMWKRIASTFHDDASRFVAMLSRPGNDFLEFNDFMILLQDIVESHPGLVFLRDAPEFHTRYMNTVIARIFYVVNRSWSGRISSVELRRSKFLQVLASLEQEEDINAVPDFFSYEHFYVIYCKFWELDTDHDLVIDKLDLMRHANGALCSRLIDRVLSGAVTRWKASNHHTQKLSYVDFVWFIISEEDKKSQTSIEYWFRCMDLDGDGKISMFEMEFFYREQMMKLEQLDIEPLPFEDCVCQMLDMVKPANEGFITLRDLKRCRLANVFFDTFFNIEKYLEHEQKDPFAPQKDVDGGAPDPSDWDRFAMEEYDILVAEEQGVEQHGDEDISYDGEFDPSIEEEFRRLRLEESQFDKGDFASGSNDFVG